MSLSDKIYLWGGLTGVIICGALMIVFALMGSAVTGRAVVGLLICAWMLRKGLKARRQAREPK